MVRIAKTGWLWSNMTASFLRRLAVNGPAILKEPRHRRQAWRRRFISSTVITMLLRTSNVLASSGEQPTERSEEGARPLQRHVGRRRRAKRHFPTESALKARLPASI